MIEVATGLSDVDQQVDNKGPLGGEQHANLTVYTSALHGPGLGQRAAGRAGPG